MAKYTIDDVFALIAREGKASYHKLAEELDVEPGVMALRNKLLKLRRQGLIRYVPAESAWELTEEGRRKAVQ